LLQFFRAAFNSIIANYSNRRKGCCNGAISIMGIFQVKKAINLIPTKEKKNNQMKNNSFKKTLVL
jgi:hypothetical protein